MKRNRVPFQKGLSLLALLWQYGTVVQYVQANAEAP